MTAQLLLFPDEQRNSPVTPDLADHLIGVLSDMKARKHLIEAALEYAEGTHTFDDVVAMVLSGKLMWSALPNSFIITEIVVYPQQKHLHGFLAGGDLSEIRDCQERLLDFARAAGCSTITLSGRRGWVKALFDLGWKESHTTIYLQVEQDHG